ncbi:hypothetical protein A4G19_08485 [Pasteurellaceae bacterium Macca]|nr:hypothetical protein [Pasteurellaceae bacterium Macca]
MKVKISSLFIIFLVGLFAFQYKWEHRDKNKEYLDQFNEYCIYGIIYLEHKETGMTTPLVDQNNLPIGCDFNQKFILNSEE